jgi:c-di-GMP-binding flagellar brake protein YcgR
MERRTTRRYDLSLPATIQGRAEQESAANQGRTRDISTKGVYLFVDGKVTVGGQLNVEIVLAAGTSDGTAGTVCAVVKVVRVEQRAETGRRGGVAGTIVRYELIRNASAGSQSINRPAIERKL